MSAAIIATSGLAVALDAVRTGPEHPQYAWAWRFIGASAPKVIAAIRDPRERTRMATQTRQALATARRRRAVELKREGLLTAAQIGVQIAVEEGHPDEFFDGRQVRRWYAEPKA